MFGGQINYQITDELWKYDITSSQWHQLNPQQTRLVQVSSQHYSLVDRIDSVQLSCDTLSGPHRCRICNFFQTDVYRQLIHI